MTELYRLHECSPTVAEAHLFAVLAESIPGLSRHKARLAIMAGLVQVDDLVVREPKHLVRGAPRLRCDLRHGIPARGAILHGATTAVTEAAITVLHLDEALVVVDKAAGILAAPTTKGERGAVGELLRRQLRRQGREIPYLGLVHRIDKETSGCMAFARDRAGQRLLACQFASHAAGRRYRCWVAGSPRRDADELTGRLGRGHDGRRAVVDDSQPGKEAVTRFKVLQRLGRISELAVELTTGRTHQIRIHLAAIGCPVLGDPVYGPRERRHPLLAGLPRAPRLMLHAESLSLDHPLSGERCTFTAPLPPAFATYPPTCR